MTVSALEWSQCGFMLFIKEHWASLTCNFFPLEDRLVEAYLVIDCGFDSRALVSQPLTIRYFSSASELLSELGSSSGFWSIMALPPPCKARDGEECKADTSIPETPAAAFCLPRA